MYSEKEEKDKILGLVVLIRTNKGIFECCLTDMVKREFFKVIDGYQIVLGAEDLSSVLTIKK